MNTSRIWLIYNKASVSPLSPINMDGSDFVIGVSVVPSSNQEEAMSLFQKDLTDNHMELLELGSVVEFTSENYLQDNPQSSVLNREVIRAAEDAARRGMVYYVCEATSETLKSEEQ